MHPDSLAVAGNIVGAELLHSPDELPVILP
jgi:hypothetical protein